MDEILEEKRREVDKTKEELPLTKLMEGLKEISPRRDFKASIGEPGRVNLIAEVKKASPSRGVIREDFDPVGIARIYEESGADALSILTDEPFFQGKLSYLDDVRKATTLPILRKDFIIDEYQIYQSALFGADAILLLSGILSKDEMERFLSLAAGLGLDCLVEAHTEEELEKALEVDPPIIGINNRNLRTFKVDLGTTQRLIGMIPKDKVIVSESGIRSHEDVERLKNLGVGAVLIGETFMESADIGAKVREVMR